MNNNDSVGPEGDGVGPEGDSVGPEGDGVGPEGDGVGPEGGGGAEGGVGPEGCGVGPESGGGCRRYKYILTFDIGIKNLAYCLVRCPIDAVMKFDILYWGIIDI